MTVTDASGKVIGTGELQYDSKATNTWAKKMGDLGEWGAETFYNWTVTVPAGQDRYGVQIGHDRGTVWFTEKQMQHGPGLSLG